MHSPSPSPLPAHIQPHKGSRGPVLAGPIQGKLPQQARLAASQLSFHTHRLASLQVTAEVAQPEPAIDLPGANAPAGDAGVPIAAVPASHGRPGEREHARLPHSQAITLSLGAHRWLCSLFFCSHTGLQADSSLADAAFNRTTGFREGSTARRRSLTPSGAGTALPGKLQAASALSADQGRLAQVTRAWSSRPQTACSCRSRCLARASAAVRLAALAVPACAAQRSH